MGNQAPTSERAPWHEDGEARHLWPGSLLRIDPAVQPKRSFTESYAIDWANLLRRSFDVDVLACPACTGRLRVLGEVTEPAMVRLLLESVGLPTEAPRAARARDPTDLLASLDGDWFYTPLNRGRACGPLTWARSNRSAFHPGRSPPIRR